MIRYHLMYLSVSYEPGLPCFHMLTLKMPNDTWQFLTFTNTAILSKTISRHWYHDASLFLNLGKLLPVRNPSEVC